jgi:hypothetical protein
VRETVLPVHLQSHHSGRLCASAQCMPKDLHSAFDADAQLQRSESSAGVRTRLQCTEACQVHPHLPDRNRSQRECTVHAVSAPRLVQGYQPTGE